VADNAKGERELAFYQTVFPHEDAWARVAETGWHGQGIPCRQQQNEDEEDCTCEKKVLALQPFVPAFHGVGLVSRVHVSVCDSKKQQQYKLLSHTKSSTNQQTTTQPHTHTQVNDVPYLILDDLTKPYASCLEDGNHDCGPSVMDIKIGRKTHGPWGRCVCACIRLFL